MSTKLTVQDIFTKSEALKPKATALATSVENFRGLDLEQGLAVHNNALIIKQAMDALTPDITSFSQRPLSVPDGTKLLQVYKELQVQWNSILTEVTKKKPLFDGLPAANMTALIKQIMKDIHAALLPLGNALVEIVPAEILEEAKKIQKEYEDAIKKALVVYQ